MSAAIPESFRQTYERGLAMAFPSLLSSVIFVEVQPGHVVTDERTGRSLTVSDTQAVCLKGRIYLTPAAYARVKAASVAA